jgi:hypothetical protein
MCVEIWDEGGQGALLSHDRHGRVESVVHWDLEQGAWGEGV